MDFIRSAKGCEQSKETFVERNEKENIPDLYGQLSQIRATKVSRSASLRYLTVSVSLGNFQGLVRTCVISTTWQALESTLITSNGHRHQLRPLLRPPPPQHHPHLPQFPTITPTGSLTMRYNCLWRFAYLSLIFQENLGSVISQLILTECSISMVFISFQMLE